MKKIKIKSKKSARTGLYLTDSLQVKKVRHGNGRCLTDEQPPSEEVAEAEFKSLVSEEQPPDEEAAEAFKWPCPLTNEPGNELLCCSLPPSTNRA